MHLYENPQTICCHFLKSGFVENYSIWTKHEETEPGTEGDADARAQDNANGPDVEDDDYGDDDHEVEHESHNDDGLDAEKLMRNVAPEVLMQSTKKGFDNIETLDKVSRDLLYEECNGCD